VPAGYRKFHSAWSASRLANELPSITVSQVAAPAGAAGTDSAATSSSPVPTKDPIRRTRAPPIDFDRFNVGASSRSVNE
jgi:hypothetical protein